MAASPTYAKPSSRHALTMLLTATSSSPSLPPLSMALSPLQFPLDASPSETTLRGRGTCSLAMLLGTESVGDNTGGSRCRYPSKRCRNTRVRKASGALHRYCAFHRTKANANQKRWVDRQRETVDSPTGSSSSSAWSDASGSPTSQAPTAYRWSMNPRPSPGLQDSSKKSRRSLDNEPTEDDDDDAAATVDAATLSDDDWDDLLLLLAPATAGRKDPLSGRPTKRSRKEA